MYRFMPVAKPHLLKLKDPQWPQVDALENSDSSEVATSSADPFDLRAVISAVRWIGVKEPSPSKSDANCLVFMAFPAMRIMQRSSASLRLNRAKNDVMSAASLAVRDVSQSSTDNSPRE